VTRLVPVALVLFACVPPASATERCALVIASQPEPEAAALASVRRALAARCQPIDDAALRAVLEGFDRPPTAEERVREALARAHARMRRFDGAGVHQALEEARTAATELPPTAEGRQLFAQLALHSAEQALVERDAAAQLKALRLALAAEPELQLDEALASPPMVALLARARAELSRAPRVAVPIDSKPPGARVWAAGWRGETPLTVELAEGPTIVWLSRPGHRSRALQVAVANGAPITSELKPLTEAERLRPLVDAIRQSAGDARRQSALALASELQVGAVAVLDPGATAPVLFEPPRPFVAAATVNELPVVSTRTKARRLWYKRAWPWVLIVGGAAAAATAVGVGVGYGTQQPATLTCCR
jgi:hypothetical protein